MPMGDILRHHADRKSPHAPALVYPKTALTWQAFEARANRLARLYQSLGVNKNDMVGIALENGPAFHVAAFAVWKLGAVPPTLSPRLPARDFPALVNFVRP